MHHVHRAATLAALTAAVALAGCSQKHAAEEAVRASLKDPESARFGEFYHNGKTKRACLTTNAKNSMGGYTGNKEVELENGKDGWAYVSEAEIAHDDCKEQWADKADSSNGE